MNREQFRRVNWSRDITKYFRYKSDYTTPVLPHINREKFPRIFCPFADDTTQHVKGLRDAGFTVTHTNGARCANGVEFSNMLDAAGDYDAIFVCAPDGMGGASAILMECIDRKLPFIMYMNLDGLPMSRLRYDYLKDNYSDLTLVLFHGSPTRFVDESLVSTEEGSLYDRFFLSYRMFDERFLFVDPQCDLFEVIDYAR